MSISPDVVPLAASSQKAEQEPCRQVAFAVLALEHLGTGVVGCDRSGSIILCNQLARLWLSASSGNAAGPWLGDPTGRVPSGTVSPIKDLLTRAMRGENVTNAEIVLPGQPARYLLANATPLSSADGSPEGALLALHDITARIQAENTLLQSKHQAARASDAKGNFLSAMSHELRTPLSAILGFAQLLRREATLSPEHASHLDLINSSGEHLLSVINQSLDMSQVEAGEHSLNPTAIALRTQIQEVAAILRPRAEEKKLTLEAFCDGANSVRIDASKLRQILFNLLGNAIKFTSHGKVSVHVRVHDQKNGAGPRLFITVEDTGPGIAPDDLARIFEPFFRAHADSAQPGTGLGLTITRQCVELLGGVILATSTPGLGSSFQVELPVEVLDDIAPAQLNLSPPQGELLSANQTAWRVLVVEDHHANANLLRRILEGAGFLVRIAESGALAIETFTAWCPHFIWMDVMMQGMDGKETTRAIRALPGGKEVKIVALSACSYRVEGAAMIAAGCDDFITKPSPAKTIVECVARHLGRSLEPEATQARNSLSAPTQPRDRALDLSEDLRAEFRRAVLSLDAKQISVMIERIRSLTPELAEHLSRLAEQLNYAAILGAVSSAKV